MYTVEAPVSGHPWEAEKVSATAHTKIVLMRKKYKTKQMTEQTNMKTNSGVEFIG